MTALITSFFIFATGLFYINEPVVTLRKYPTVDSHVQSQAIFSETVTVDQKSDEWAQITTADHVSGWIPLHALIERETPYRPTLMVSRLVAHVYGIRDTEFGPIVTLPYGTLLQAVDEVDPRWITVSLLNGQTAYIQKGDVTPEQELCSKADLADFSLKFLNLPYTWGGRSSFGYDCSGFVQMLYSKIGIQLPRNSRQQIADDRFQTIAIENLEPGDLIFFGKANGVIVHVGMYLGSLRFIHATVQEYKPWLRISSLTDFEWSGDTAAACPVRIARQLRPRSELYRQTDF